MLDQLTAADFHPRVGQSFRLVQEGGEPIEAVLTEVTEHGEAPPEHRAPFSIFFNAPVGTAVAQGIFGIEHDELEGLELFLVPVEVDAAGDGVLYEAVFG